MKIYLINHVSAEAPTTGRMIPSETNSHRPSDSNKNVDIKCIAHDAFLE